MEVRDGQPGNVISLHVEARDPLTTVGTIEVLRPIPDIRVMTAVENGVVTADAVLVIVDGVDPCALQVIRRSHAIHHRPVVLIAGALDEESVLAAVEAGARAILRRQDATASTVAALIRSAVRGEGTIPNDVLGRLLDQVGRLQEQVLTPHGLRINGLSERETQVLRLVAEGLDTAEIAERLNFSQRTIKGDLHDLAIRLNLKNRAHAVAYALREGLI